MTAHLNIGFNWDMECAEGLVRLNESLGPDNDTRIDMVYGSTSFNPIGSARPPSRIQDVSQGTFVAICEFIRSHGIKINYTINTSSLGDLKYFEANRNTEFKTFLQWLQGHVDLVTVAHQLVLEMVLEHTPELDIEMSTILNIDSLGHFIHYSQWPQIKKICLAIGRNRDMSFIKKAVNANSIIPEILANEFCTISGHNCSGIYRSSCYECHAQNSERRLGNYPMKQCTASRWGHPSAWLKAKFVLPQWMAKYEELTGLNHFKVTGRTHPTPYILEMTESYLRRNYQGNILGLWAQLETIWEGFQSQKPHVDRVVIQAEDIENFINHWFNAPNFRCSEQMCGILCRYCDKVYDEITGVSVEH